MDFSWQTAYSRNPNNIKYFQYEILCLSRGPSCNHALTIIAPPQFLLFCCMSLSFFFANYCWPQPIKCVRLKCDCNTIALLQSSTLYTVNATAVGVLLFHWLVAFQVDISVWEGVTCLQILWRWKLPENLSSLNKLIRYFELTVFCEI